MALVPPTAPTVPNPPAGARVAVVAVHGVGHHQTGASSDAIANLLSGIGGYSNPPWPASYSSFITQPIQFPLPGASFFPSQQIAPPPRPGGFWSWFGGFFEERRGYFAGKFTLKAWRTTPRTAMAATDLADEFMKVQLGDYEGGPLENTLRTDRLEGHRPAAGGRSAADVHIYDMQWADVGRGDSTFVRFFTSVYQLLIHLVSLARIAVDMAALEHQGKWDWFLLQRAHNYCARVLTLFIFSFLALLTAVAFSPVPLLLNFPGNETTAMAIAAGVFFVAINGGVLLLSQQSKAPFGSRGWWPWLFAAGALSIIISVLVFAKYDLYLAAILTTEWWMLQAGILWFVFRKYDEVRPGALAAGRISFVLVAAGFIGCLGAQEHEHVSNLALRTASLWMIQYIFLALRMAWMLFIILAIASLVFEWICHTRLRLSATATPGERARARAGLRTGRFALALPATLMLILHVFLWSGVYHFIAPRVNLFQDVVPKSVPVWPWLQWLVLSPQDTDAVFHALNPADCREPVWNPYHFLEGLILQGAPPGFPIVLGLIALGLTLLVLMALPSVISEFQTPYSAPNSRARFLGSWLSSGFHNFRAMIWCFWIAAFAAPAVYPLVVFGLASRHKTIALGAVLENLYTSWGMKFTSKLVSTSGALIAGSAALLLGFLVKYLSAALDAILDVDTYLRTTPKENVPRARIVERYVALLRYLHQYAPDGRPYDKIIIVAHSLGSVISADLLRFLKRRTMPALTRFAFADLPSNQRPPIYLFTMGNPLRQLLSRFFPHLYQWVREVPDGGGELPAIRMLGVPIDAAATPNPVTELGVVQWINYYRSGDYIGRSIWEDDWFLRTATGDGAFPDGPDVFEDPATTRVEACIGLGAHTHYWDRTAPDVAIRLDSLI